MREQIVGHVEKNRAFGKDEYRHWKENMNKLTKGLKMDSGKATTEGSGLHTLCKQREKEEHHDTKWKYKTKSSVTNPTRKGFTGA
eukprot:11891539-Heterocapsa_arctica.AAC.1